MNAHREITDREQLINALTDAAELEHAVICQYLFAAHSLKSHPSESGVNDVLLESVREWQADILGVARSEMEHLGLVCNLLSAIGGCPHFHRANLPTAGRFCQPGSRFELMPFSDETLCHFMNLERQHSKSDADFDTIFDAYHRIRRGFETMGSNGMLFVGDVEMQIENRHIDLTPGWHDFHLVPVTDVTSAVAAIDVILEAGHNSGEHIGNSHYERFARTLADFQELRQQNPEFKPVRPVVNNPVTRGHVIEFAERCTPIDHPLTRRAALLFNAAYESTLMMMTRYYMPGDESNTERLVLGKIAMYPMMTLVLRPLAELLTQMPVNLDFPGPTAGPTFELPSQIPLHPHRRSAWFVLYERLLDLAAESHQLLKDIDGVTESWSPIVLPRLSFLCENLQSIAVRFEYYMQMRKEQTDINLKKLMEFR